MTVQRFLILIHCLVLMNGAFLFAEEQELTPSFDEKGQLLFFQTDNGPTYSVDWGSNGTFFFKENEKPLLNYHFGAVPLPEDVEIHHFGVGPTAYDGAYFSDGSAFGGERSDYIQPLFGFSGEILTDDFPQDHPHHRGCWLSFCEVRWNEKLGDLWAVCKIRAYPKKITQIKSVKDFDSGKNAMQIEVVNVWRYDDDPTEIVEETVTIEVSSTSGEEGQKSRTIDVSAKLKALVEGVSIAGRQKVDYGGYSGMAVRMNPKATDFSIRVVHPKPDQWNGAENSMAERISDPDRFGNASWIAIYGKYPHSNFNENDKENSNANNQPNNDATDLSQSADLADSSTGDFTTLGMFESVKNPLYPNQFRYYSSRNIMIAFPGFSTLALPKDETVLFQTRFWLRQGKTTLDEEKQAWDEYQQSISQQ